MDESQTNPGRGYVRVEKTGWDTSRVAKMTGGDLSRRGFFCTPKWTYH